jgi:hypothetical protein
VKIIERYEGGWYVTLDRVVGTVVAMTPGQVASVMDHYYRPKGFRRSHIEGTHRTCPLCAKMRKQDAARRRIGGEA